MKDRSPGTWQPDLYLKFGKERTQPAVDLASRVDLAEPKRILDIGCGPGNSTAVLRSRWPDAHVTGVDNSPEMIDKARADFPAGEWTVADFREWNPGTRYDLVFSNATLHWIPNHEELLPRLFAMTGPGGAVAAQVPAILDSPLHRAARRVAQAAEWKELLRGSEETLTYHPETFYHDHLSRLSSRVELWHTIYYHVMAAHNDIIEWYAGTGLKVYLGRIQGDENKQKFKDQVLAECAAQYPAAMNGKILFPFKRLFMVAYT